MEVDEAMVSLFSHGKLSPTLQLNLKLLLFPFNLWFHIPNLQLVTPPNRGLMRHQVTKR